MEAAILDSGYQNRRKSEVLASWPVSVGVTFWIQLCWVGRGGRGVVNSTQGGPATDRHTTNWMDGIAEWLVESLLVSSKGRLKRAHYPLLVVRSSLLSVIRRCWLIKLKQLGTCLDGGLVKSGHEITQQCQTITSLFYIFGPVEVTCGEVAKNTDIEKYTDTRGCMLPWNGRSMSRFSLCMFRFLG